MVVNMKMAVFWDCLLITLMMEAVQASEMLVNSYQFTWRYNPEDSHLHHGCSLIKLHLIPILSSHLHLC
jgi:hypothetical protein